MYEAKQWGEEIPPSEVVDPIVFHFRPNKFLAIDEKHRGDFERFFRENVGFPPRVATKAAPLTALPARYPNGGISGSNGGWDD